MSLQDGASSWEKEMPLPLPCAQGERAAVPTPAPTAQQGLALHPLGHLNQGSFCSSTQIRGFVPPWEGQQGCLRPPALLTEASPAHQQLPKAGKSSGNGWRHEERGCSCNPGSLRTEGLRPPRSLPRARAAPSPEQSVGSDRNAIYARRRPSRFMTLAHGAAQTRSHLRAAGSSVRGIRSRDPRSHGESLKEHQRQTCAVTPADCGLGGIS